MDGDRWCGQETFIFFTVYPIPRGTMEPSFELLSLGKTMSAANLENSRLRLEQ